MTAMSIQEHSPALTLLKPELHADQARLYRDVLRILGEHRVPCAVSGAFAMQHHTGIWRATNDLEIFLTPETAPMVLDLLGTQGLLCEICDPVWLAKAHRDDFFVAFITGMSNAALTVTDSWIVRSNAALVVDVETHILAVEELVASKLFAMQRERFDGADIVHAIYATGGRLDWSRVLYLAGSHWEILLWALLLFRYVYPAQSHFVPLLIWTELINSLVLKLLNPDPSARFRGSLVDEQMFAIDLKKWGLDDLLSEYRTCRTKRINWQPRVN